MSDSTIVSLVSAQFDVCSAVAAAMEAAGWRAAIPRGAPVAIKPNLGWDLFLPGAVTSPRVVEGVIRVLQGWAGEVYLVEADQVLVRCERALRQTRMDRLCARYGVTWINLSQAPFVRVLVPDPLALDQLELPELLTRAHLITVPVMKTHNKTVITGAIKNQWGCLPTFRHNFHPIVHEVLRDLSRVLRPAFAVMDATVALEGDAPKSGRPRICDLVLASRDPVALDTIASEIMALDDRPIRYLDLCARDGVGVRDRARIQVVGEKGSPWNALPRLAFAPARSNLISRVEERLRSSALHRLAFEGPLLRFFCTGARFWYFLWYYLGRGRRLRERVMKTYAHADQWRA